MATSSVSHKNPLDQDEEEHPQNWLELGLGLGLGFSTRSKTDFHDGLRLDDDDQYFATPFVNCSSVYAGSVPYSDNHGQELGLGLGHKVYDEMFVRENNALKKDVAPPPPPPYNQCCNHHQTSSHDGGTGGGGEAGSSGSVGGGSGADREAHNYKCSSRPTTTHPGFWFTLQASTHQREEVEAALPQIPKAYIRVKNEEVTILMIKKYLVTKLGLSNEAEIEICCVGKKLSNTLALKQVRDTVWLPRLIESLKFTNYQNLTHLMSLQYGRPNSA